MVGSQSSCWWLLCFVLGVGEKTGGRVGQEHHGDWYCLCRVDVGLVLYEGLGQFGYHMKFLW